MLTLGSFLLLIVGLVCLKTLNKEEIQATPLKKQPLSKNNPTQTFKPTQSTQTLIEEAYGKLPLRFESNNGQTDKQVKFISHGSGYSLFLTANKATLALKSKEKSKSAVLEMEMLGSNSLPKVIGIDPLPTKSNYFIGNDPKKWNTGLINYTKVKYQSVYPGIDLVYYGNQEQLEYDFVLSPNADPKEIRLGFNGANSLEINDQGQLILHTLEGEIRQHKPIIYQEKDGIKETVEGRYILKNEKEIGFEVDNYDRNRPLIIDPILSYSSYLGGSGAEGGTSIVVDSAGNAYVAGVTASSNYPTVNALQPSFAGGVNDVIVTKINPTGTSLVYSTYVGGSNNIDQGFGIALDSTGSVYVTGFTQSNNFPTVNAIQSSNGGGADAFLFKLNPMGNTLVYSTYLGGSGSDSGSGIAVDSLSNVYVVGGTASGNFPITPGVLQTTNSGGNGDFFVTKINALGSAFIYSTYLGGSGLEAGDTVRVALDSSGNAYVIGAVNSSNFPTVNPIQPSNGGGLDAIVAKINPLATALVYSTYLGGNNDDLGSRIKIDSGGNAYIAGFTFSNNFPVLNPFQATRAGNFDAFLSKLNPAGNSLIFSTYLGGSSSDIASGLEVDSLGNIYLCGSTGSTNFPVMDSLQMTNAGGTDGFLVKFNPTASTLIYSTYFGGSAEDIFANLTIDTAKNLYLIGSTTSSNLPTTPGVFQPIYAGAPGFPGDLFVVKISNVVDCQDLQEQVDMLTEENTQLQNQVLTLTQQNSQLQSMVSSLTQENTQLQNQLNTANQTIANLQTQVSQLQTQVATLTQQNSQLQNQVNQLQTENTQLQNQLNSANQTITNLQTQVSQLQTQVTNLQTQVANLQTQLTNAQAQITQLQNELSIIKSPTEQVDSSIQSVQTLLSSAPQNAQSALQGALKKLQEARISLAVANLEQTLKDIKAALQDLNTAANKGVNTTAIQMALVEGVAIRVQRAVSDVTTIVGRNNQKVQEATALLQSGQTLLAQGKFKEALDAFEDALKKVSSVK